MSKVALINDSDYLDQTAARGHLDKDPLMNLGEMLWSVKGWLSLGLSGEMEKTWNPYDLIKPHGLCYFKSM